VLGRWVLGRLLNCGGGSLSSWAMIRWLVRVLLWRLTYIFDKQKISSTQLMFSFCCVKNIQLKVGISKLKQFICRTFWTFVSKLCFIHSVAMMDTKLSSIFIPLLFALCFCTGHGIRSDEIQEVDFHPLSDAMIDHINNHIQPKWKVN
jgi:hypothetical protein